MVVNNVTTLATKFADLHRLTAHKLKRTQQTRVWVRVSDKARLRWR